MCTPAQIATYMLADLFHRDGDCRQAFVVMHGESLEAIVSGDQGENPGALLAKYCQALGGDVTERRCVPILLPKGLQAGVPGDFKVVHEGDGLRIEFK